MKKKIIMFLMFLVGIQLSACSERTEQKEQTDQINQNCQVPAYQTALSAAAADGPQVFYRTDSYGFIPAGKEESVYRIQGISSNDALSADQWALSNDGSFRIDESGGNFPVLSVPFGQAVPQGTEGTDDVVSAAGTGMAAGMAATAGIDINAETAWNRFGAGGREAVIALIDTGVDYGHEDLSGAVWVNPGEIPDNGIDDDGNGYIDDVYGWNFHDNNNIVLPDSGDGHGTHGAGTIGAVTNNGLGISGIVPGGRAKIMVLKALGGSDGGGKSTGLVEAIRYAQANGAVICNLSLSSDESDQAVYQAIGNSDMLFVVSAGNGNGQTNQGRDIDAQPSYPASYPLDNIISVANLSFDGSLYPGSNYGAAGVDIAAPGTFILSTVPGSSYGYMTGTSMAAPMVSAAAAMVYSHYPDITMADVKEILLSSARPLDSLAGRTLTGGMLDAGAALSYDTGRLSGRKWQRIGYAPDIEIELDNREKGSFLIVRFHDSDGDLALASYGPGAMTAEQFAGGSGGTVLSVDEKGEAQIPVSGTGSFTFYARDHAGNEAVKTVNLYASEQ